MNAIEFVKKFGVGRAIELVSEVSKSKKLKWYTPQIDINLEPHEFGFSFDEIKQIVDAFNLLESFGGLFQAKVALYKEGFTGGIECGDSLIEDDVLKRAIELVEKCNEI